MSKALRLTAALLASLAIPALAQTPSAGSAGANRNTSPPPASAAPSTTGTATTAQSARPGTSSTTNTARPTPAAPSATTTPSTTPSTTTTTTTTPSPRTTTGAAAGTATGATAGAARATATGGRIDINGATEQQLDTLPGVGPARAKAIITGRPWDDLNDLVKKGALPQNVLDSLKGRLALANINTSSAADMAKTLPGIGEVRSRNIVNGRPYGQPQDLVTKGVLTQNQFDKIKDLVAY